MKTRKLLGLIAVTMIITSACNNAINDEKGIAGKWTFKTLTGEYAELWADDSSLIMLRTSAKAPAYFNYIHSGDSIKLYNPEDANYSRLVNFLMITSRSDNNVKFTQGTIDNELHRINDSKPDVNQTTEFAQEIISEFSERANLAHESNLQDD